MAQFDRIYKLTVGVEGSDGVTIQSEPKRQGLTISFDIRKDLTTETNKCRIQVYNLSSATSKLMERDDSVCLLEVGYSEDIGLRRIFVGEITQASSKYDGSGNKITELYLSDGQKAIRDCVVSLSYADKVSRQKVVDDIAAEMGLLTSYAEGLEFTSFANGFSFIGAGRVCLDKVCAGTNLRWSIQNNVLQIIQTGDSTKVQALRLAADSGLIGYPERIIKGVKRANKLKLSKRKSRSDRKAGWRLTCLLQPTLNPGDLVYVESKTITGWYKIESLHHTGDYSGQNWYSEIEVYEIGGIEGG